jgi:predicted dinucleotide-binding enzyme
MTIGILGGTGPQGRGLTRRLAAAGHPVVIGSRSADRAQAVAAEYDGIGEVTGADTAAAKADLVIITVPYDGHADLLRTHATELAGKQGDVLVLGENREAVRQVCELATAIPGARGIYPGRLRNAGQVKALTANLIAINRRYKAHSSILITDLP